MQGPERVNWYLAKRQILSPPAKRLEPISDHRRFKPKYTAERLAGGCMLYRLPSRLAGGPLSS